jgi:hypothetical protein
MRYRVGYETKWVGVWKDTFILKLVTRWDELSASRSIYFTHGKSHQPWYPLNRKLGGLHNLSGRLGEKGKEPDL